MKSVSQFIKGASGSLFTGLALIALLVGCKKPEPTPADRIENPETARYVIETTDVRGRTVRLEHPPIEIVSLLPSLTEYVFELDRGHLLVGRSNRCRYPEAALDVEVVGGLKDPTVETLVELNPDLILVGSFVRDEQVNHLESLGLTVATFDHQNWETLVRDLNLLGKLLNCSGDVKTLISWLDKQRTAIRDTIAEFATSKPVSTAILYALQPLNTSGNSTFVDEMIKYAGGINIATNLSSSRPMLSLEDLLEKQPDVLLVSSEAGSPETLTAQLRQLRNDPTWARLNAIRNNRVYLLECDPLTLPGTRHIKTLRQIAAALHPDLFERPPSLIHVDLFERPRLP